MKALVLSGGGARGAYQAGVLMAVADMASSLKIKSPFKIYTGVSAGAINAAFLATGAEDFSRAAHDLGRLWSSLRSELIFKTDAISLGKIGLKWMGELSFGGLTGGAQSRSLLDTAPLGDLLRNNLEFNKIQQNIESDHIHAVAVTALDYNTSRTITFVQGRKDIEMWHRTRRSSEFAELQPEHILASSAIPLLFSPAQVDERYFGDGCIRNQTPISPALHLGAESLFIIGVRKQDMIPTEDQRTKNQSPSVARISNVLLNSVLLDGIEVDIERLTRINAFLGQVQKNLHESLNFRSVNHLWVHPSDDIGTIASSMSSKLPRVIRYLLKGLGPLDDASEIISYLLFEPEFCKRLIEIGYEDGMKSEESIKKFLLA